MSSLDSTKKPLKYITKIKMADNTNSVIYNITEQVNNKEIDYMVIFLHGLGADANDLVPLVSEFKLNYNFKFILPTAPKRSITINGGLKMNAWYDIIDTSRINSLIDHQGILESVSQIEEIIAQQVSLGVDPNKIFVAGFSQGAAICYSLLLKTTYQLRGFIIISGYLPDINMINNDTNKINCDTPILACHGKLDNVVPYDLGLLSYENLKKHQYNIVWRNYHIAHTMSFDEINDIASWLNSKT